MKPSLFPSSMSCLSLSSSFLITERSLSRILPRVLQPGPDPVSILFQRALESPEHLELLALEGEVRCLVLTGTRLHLRCFERLAPALERSALELTEAVLPDVIGSISPAFAPGVTRPRGTPPAPTPPGGRERTAHDAHQCAPGSLVLSFREALHIEPSTGDLLLHMTRQGEEAAILRV